MILDIGDRDRRHGMSLPLLSLSSLSLSSLSLSSLSLSLLLLSYLEFGQKVTD